MLANLAALLAAALFAAASAVQHRAARSSPHIGGGTRNARRALFTLLARPLWLIGLSCDVAGFGFHAYALTTGQLAVVQPLLVTGLLFALPLGAWLERRRITAGELVWAGVTTVALAAFLTLAQPSGGTDVPELGPAIGTGVGSLLLVVGCLAFGRGNPTRRAAALGVLTGLAYGLTAALIKSVGSEFGADPGSVFTSWPLYVLLVIGPAGFLLNQIAFQAGPLAASLPAISAVDPVVSVVLGVTAFDEQLRGGPVRLGVEAMALVLLAVAIVALARVGQRSVELAKG